MCSILAATEEPKNGAVRPELLLIISGELPIQNRM